uniref:ZAD domain-containing protein n=1 Tax=Anopheles funestus TaxID=62324 RepID=A0A182RZK0_ANOFN
MTTITLPRQDITKFCRFCLSEINLLNVIDSSPADQQAHGELLRLANTYLKIEFQPEKDFPCAVCEMCIALLHDFDTLYKNAQDYHYALKVLSESSRIEDVEAEIPASTINPALGNMYESSPLVFIDMDNNGFEEELLVSNALEGHIVLEDVPLNETDEQEAQIDVYHVDGELQHIVMDGGTCIEVKPKEVPKPSPPQPPRGNLLNVSLAKAGTNLSVRKRIAPPNATPTPQLPKKPLPMKPSSVPVNNTPTRTLNPEANTKRSSQPAGHKQYVAAGPKQLYRCNHCSSLFVELSNLYSHVCQKRQREPIHNSLARPSVISVDGQRFSCKLCSMSYRSKLQYQKHEYEVHGIRNENFGIKCTICQKLFSQRQDYQLHMRAIHPTQGMSFMTIHNSQ